MIFELIFIVIITFMQGVLGLLFQFLGQLPDIPNWSAQFIDLLSVGLFFFPSDVFMVVVLYFVGWYTVKMSWSIITFAIRKIPGIS